MPMYPAAVGEIINNRYEFLEVLGQGGMGIVVRARRLKDDRLVAIKLCHLREIEARRRFAREIRLMRSIKHRHIMPILAASVKHDPPYFVMPLAQRSCAELLPEYSEDEAKAIDVFMGLCEGVAAIHGAGAIHRDIKPHNMLMLKGRVVLADMGLAKLSRRDSTTLTRTDVAVGTEDYWAPEQRMPGGSKNADVRTDIYQLGKTLYQFLTGLSPVLMDFRKVPAGLDNMD